MHYIDLGEKKWGCSRIVDQLFIYFTDAYDSSKIEVIHNILTEFGVPMKIARIVKIRVNETCRKIFASYILYSE